ncbi:hypothetical protein FRB95_002720 [Tulasnella sp. JGI-2019a]|nr:hypothetical protein FRB95_002720 [Tulasnella sp. JGI-2019a]
MSQFSDLPVEILPTILHRLSRYQDLWACCLASRIFYELATPVLYQWIYVFSWRKNGKEKVRRLFDTLASCPHLARYVEILGEAGHAIIDATKTAHSSLFLCLELRECHRLMSTDTVNRGVSHCVNLQKCVWTRDGTLTSETLGTLRANCPQLKVLELNGNSSTYYDPTLLVQFSSLTNLSVIMPDRAFVNAFPEWIKATGHSLKSISLICKSSPLIDDEMMKHIAAHSTKLEQLHLIGTPHVTDAGVAAVVAGSPSLISISFDGGKRISVGSGEKEPPEHDSRHGSHSARGKGTQELRSLSLEGVSPHFDMKSLSLTIARRQALRHLSTLSITQPSHVSPTDFFPALTSILSMCPLEYFQIWTPGGELGRKGSVLTYDFVQSLVQTHGSRLKKFAVQRMETSLEIVNLVCRGCPALEQLYIVLKYCDADILASHLRRLSVLHTLHISYTLNCTNPILPQHQSAIISLVRRCTSSLKLVGILTRVFEVIDNM